MPVKVLVADDNEIVRSALVRMLKADADLAVIGELWSRRSECLAGC